MTMQHSSTAQQALTNKTHAAEPLYIIKLMDGKRWQSKEWSNLYLRRHIADHFTSAQINKDGNQAEKPQLCCLLPACLCACPPQWLYLMKILVLRSHALLYGHASVGKIRGLPCIYQPGEEEGSDSPPSQQTRLAHLLVSPALLGHSSQPLSNRRAREWAFRGGWEVLRGLKQTCNGEQSTSSSYMSDCSQWTCYCWSLGPPPVLLRCMSVCVCVCSFLCVCASVRCVKTESLP